MSSLWHKFVLGGAYASLLDLWCNTELLQIIESENQLPLVVNGLLTIVK